MPRPWTVMPHGPLEPVDLNLWCVRSAVPGLPGLDRRMYLVRRGDGGLVFYNAVPVDEPTLSAIRALGTPAQLIVPHELHAMDAAAFRERLGVRAYGPAARRQAVAMRVPLDGTFEELPPDPAIAVESVAGVRTGEGVLLVRSGPRLSLAVADVVTHVPHGRGLRGAIFRLVGFTGPEPKLPPPVRLRVVRDRAALRAHLERLAASPGLTRILLSHGPVVERDPAGVLRRIAGGL
ncbi:MAG TPA: hypothetical protein VMU15_09670 [Anaeromyxobacter sp.]|nr:hypothetical protein [Anaeromyxobacter sp.]